MKIAVTGANGFVGKHLLAALHDQYILAIGRTHVDNVDHFLTADLSLLPKIEDSLKGIDVVIHCAARAHIMSDKALNPLLEYRSVNVEGTLNLAKQAAQAGVKRFIYLSSIKVNGESTIDKSPFTYMDEPNPEDAYGVSKLEAEVGLSVLAKSTGLEVVIIRSPLVYGPGVKGNLATMLNILKKGIPLPLGRVCNKRSLVSVFNLVDLIITCIDHPKAANQTFLVSDGHDLSSTELLHQLGKAIGRPSILFPVPFTVMVFFAKLLGKKSITDRLFGSLQVDIRHTCKTLDWLPPLSVEESMKRSFCDKVL